MIKSLRLKTMSPYELNVIILYACYSKSENNAEQLIICVTVKGFKYRTWMVLIKFEISAIYNTVFMKGVLHNKVLFIIF